MPDRITSPGIYPDFPVADYMADPCPTPSLTQSVAKILLDASPLHAWHAHPRLNPDFVPDDDPKFDVGNVAHKLFLGRGKEIEILDAPDWNATGMGKGAKVKLHADRDAIRASGRLAVLGKTYSRAVAMVRAAEEQLGSLGLDDFQSDNEAAIAWHEDGMWLRSMIDKLAVSRKLICDYKTTGMSCAPHAIGRLMESAGWAIQAAMHERGLDVLDPVNAGRRRHLFIAQEDTRPYALTVAEISEATLTMGRKMLSHAVDIWHSCIESNRWPGYPQEIIAPQFPSWAESQWLAREVEHQERGRETMLTDLAGG